MAKKSQATDQLSLSGKEIVELGVAAAVVTTSFHQLSSSVPIIGTAAKYFAEVAITAKAIGTLATAIPEFSKTLFKTPDSVKTGGSDTSGPGIGGGSKSPLYVEIDHPLPLPVEVVNFPGQENTTASSTAGSTELEEAGGAAAGEEVAGSAIAGPVGIIAAVALVAATQIKQLGEEAIQTGFKFAGIANPATIDRYNLAVSDAQAVLGQRFIPVVEFATQGVRMIGDFLVEALPPAESVRTALTEMQPAIDEVKGALHDAAPLIQTVAVAGLEIFAEAVKFAAKQITVFVEGLRAIGLIGGRNAAPQASSFGASAQNASVGSVEDVGRKLFESALSQGRTADPAERSAGSLANIEAFLAGKLAAFITTVESHLPNLTQAQNTGNTIAGNIAGTLGSALSRFGF